MSFWDSLPIAAEIYNVFTDCEDAIYGNEDVKDDYNNQLLLEEEERLRNSHRYDDNDDDDLYS